MAKALASLDAAAVGVDVTHYLRELGISSGKCSYPAAAKGRHHENVKCWEMTGNLFGKKLTILSYSTPRCSIQVLSPTSMMESSIDFGEGSYAIPQLRQDPAYILTVSFLMSLPYF
jgi:hypothetical protein